MSDSPSSLASLAGELSIDLTLRGGVVTGVDIASSRPQLAQTLLAGRPAAAVLAVIPRLFSVCGRAQGVAAELALQAARGDGGAPGALADAARAQRVEMEIAQESLWRMLLDWPQQVGSQPDTALLADLRRRLDEDPAGKLPATRDALRSAVESQVLGGDAEAWFGTQRVAGFERWLAQGTTPAARLLAAVQRDGARHGAPADEVPLLPAMTDRKALSQIAGDLLRDPGFARRPRYGYRPAETGAVARLASQPLVAALLAAYGRSTLTRLAARLTELARIAAGLPGPAVSGAMSLAAPAGLQRGLGWVESARGLLIHMVDIDDAARGERVVRYWTLAPTEWNFHPRGALAAGLLGVHVGSTDELRRRAGWLVQALDPCVAHRIELHEEATHA